jgi:hypothetical protein
MELKEFVTKTLKEMIEGVKEAQDAVKDTGAIINPAFVEKYLGPNVPLIYDPSEKSDLLGAAIDFDIAVTTTTTDEAKAGMGIFVAPFSIGAQGKIEGKNSNVSRIKFTINVIFPSGQ